MKVDISELVERGDLCTDSFDPSPTVGRYLGNGRFGGVYSTLGLHAPPAEKDAFDVHGLTQFTHISHWGRFAFHSASMGADTTADYLLPLARIYWERQPAEIERYCQRQSFYNGTLETEFTDRSGNSVFVTNWFDPVQRNLAVITITASGEVSPVILTVPTGFAPYPFGYNEPATQTCTISKHDSQWVIEATCTTANPPAVSRLYVRSDAAIETCPEGLRITPPQGTCSLFISYGEAIGETGAAASLARTRQWWNDTWSSSAWFAFPDGRCQAMWIRSLAYILSSFNNDGLGFTSTNGLTGNFFPFNFAQDLFYLHPVLLASGHVDVARSWIERFSDLIDGMREYAKRLWPEVEGIYPPWELPYGPIEGYHTPSVPIFYCYEPHNAAYLARMAHDTAAMLDDPAWTQAKAVPLIREIALFFKSFCKKEADGQWHLFLTPAIGQDEAGGRNQKDYLCAFYGARYSFQKAIEHGLDSDGVYETILDDGLAFESLLSPQGFYYASAGSGEKDFGKQKHPVQLNGLAYLPVDSEPQPAERVAHALRYDTTSLATKPHFFGWTLGEFLLASSRIGDASGWLKDWENIRPSNYTDASWAQLYETSGATRQSFYVTTHGLVAQSLMNNVVSDFWGLLLIGSCLPGSGSAQFGNFRSGLGVTVDGEISGGIAQVTLRAWKDCRLQVNEKQVSLQRGETVQFQLVLSATP